MENVAEAIVGELVGAGIRTVYGLPGGELVELLEAVRVEGIRFVLVQRESAAVFMGSAAARLTGRPSVCLTTLGPGAANAVAGVAHAYLDRTPVLVITAQMAQKLRPLHTHQYLDLRALFAPVTKASFSLGPRNVRSAMREALSIAQSERPGAVHLELPSDQAGLSVEPHVRKAGESDRITTQPLNWEGALEKALGLLSASRRPIILAGLGLEPQAPYAALRQLAEAGEIPLVVTPKAKGALPADHPLFAGTVGLTRFDPVEEVLEEADCVLAVGLDVVELVKPWAHHSPMVWIAPWENRDPALPVEAELVGELEPFLKQLKEVVFSTQPEWGLERLERFRRDTLGRTLPEPKRGHLRPQDVLHSLRDALPRETYLSTDVGSHKILFCLEWPAYLPNRFLVSNGLSSMGFALPAAVAAAIQNPESLVVCTLGDAGLLMQLGDLNLLRELALHVLVVVFKDNALDLIRSHQIRAGKMVFGTEFNAPNFVQISEGFGIQADRVTDLRSLREATEGWLRSRKEPRLLEVLIDPVSYPTTTR